jgi:chitinase
MDGYYSKKYERWDDKAKVPYLSYSKARGANKCGLISFENTRSLTEKAKYVRENDLGGVLVWNIGTGYMPEASRSKRHELLRAVATPFIE